MKMLFVRRLKSFLPNPPPQAGEGIRGIFLLAVVVLLTPVFALAHVSFDHAEPRVGAKVEKSPTAVKVWFSDDVDAALCDVVVTDAQGKRVDKQDVHVDPTDKTLIIVGLPELAAGKYTVSWRAACVDKHKVKGSFKFEVKS